MKFKYGNLSEKRCKELSEMKIECPNRYEYCLDGRLNFSNEKFTFSEDESIVFTWAFTQKGVSSAGGMELDDIYILIKDKEYYLFFLEKKEIIHNDDGPIEKTAFFRENKSINIESDLFNLFVKAYIHYAIETYYFWHKNEDKNKYKAHLNYGGNIYE